MMSMRGYRFLFITYPVSWRMSYEDEVLATLRESDTADGRRAASPTDRFLLLIDGLSRRVPRPAHPVYVPLLVAAEHRFDQTNGLIVEREPSADELSHSRWWDQEDTPSFIPVGMVAGRPNSYLS